MCTTDIAPQFQVKWAPAGGPEAGVMIPAAANVIQTLTAPGHCWLSISFPVISIDGCHIVSW
jgi:hypothetical protein